MLVMALLALLGGYVLTSVVLFKFPLLIHKKKELKFRCCHISHRGGAAEKLENTLGAFEHAILLGTDMLEIDLHLTKDGHVVISHDNNLLRSTGVDKNITELDYDELPLLKPSLPVDFDYGNLSAGGSDRKIPLLKDVYERFPSIPINIDIKIDDDQLIKKVSELTKQYRREEFTVWGNFQDRVTKKCYKENPQMPVLFSSKRVFHLILLTYTGLLPFVGLKESCLEIFMPAIIEKNADSMFRQRPSYKLLRWMLDKLLMRKAIFRHLDKRGIQTYLWVLNEEKEFDQAFALGATGVMTDYPSRLSNYLENNPRLRHVGVADDANSQKHD